MKYTAVLSEEQNGEFHATVPGLPECTVAAGTRGEAIDALRETVAEVVSRSEIIELDIATVPKSTKLSDETPWPLFGAFKEDPTWGDLFEEIERKRAGTTSAG